MNDLFSLPYQIYIKGDYSDCSVVGNYNNPQIPQRANFSQEYLSSCTIVYIPYLLYPLETIHRGKSFGLISLQS